MSALALSAQFANFSCCCRFRTGPIRRRWRLPKSINGGNSSARPLRQRSYAAPPRPGEDCCQCGAASAWRIQNITIPAANKFKPAVLPCEFQFHSSVRCTGTCRQFPWSLALIGTERALQRDVAVYAIDHAFLGFAIETILCVNLVMRQPHRHALERQFLVICIEPQRHGRAGTEDSREADRGPGQSSRRLSQVRRQEIGVVRS